MTARKKGSAPIVLRWQRALQEYRDIPNDNPPRYAVVGIAGVLVSFSDPDGRNCRPAIGTIVWQVGISERTAVLALAWLVEHGWLEVTRRTGTRPTVYRLTIPVPAEEQVPGTAEEQDQDTSPVLLRSRTRIESAPAAGTADGTAPEQDDLRTSEAKAEEEEESAGAPSVCTPVAALSRVDLFSDHGGGDPEVVEIRGIALVIARRARMDLDPGRSRLALEMTTAKARAGWSDFELVAYCADKLRRAKPKDPTAWLATDLRTRVTASTIVPVVANLRAEYGELLLRLRELSPGDAEVEPESVLEELLSQAGVIGPEEGLWDQDMPEDHLEQAIKVAKQVLAESKANT